LAKKGGLHVKNIKERAVLARVNIKIEKILTNRGKNKKKHDSVTNKTGNMRVPRSKKSPQGSN